MKSTADLPTSTFLETISIDCQKLPSSLSILPFGSVHIPGNNAGRCQECSGKVPPICYRLKCIKIDTLNSSAVNCQRLLPCHGGLTPGRGHCSSEEAFYPVQIRQNHYDNTTLKHINCGNLHLLWAQMAHDWINSQEVRQINFCLAAQKWVFGWGQKVHVQRQALILWNMVGLHIMGH